MKKLLPILLCSIYCSTSKSYFAAKSNFPLTNGVPSELPKESLPEVAQVNQRLSLDEIERKTYGLLFKPNMRPKLGPDF